MVPIASNVTASRSPRRGVTWPGCSAATRAASRAGSVGGRREHRRVDDVEPLLADRRDALQLVQLAQRRQRARRAGGDQPDVGLVACGGGQGGEPDGGGVEPLDEAGERARRGALDQHLASVGSAAARVSDSRTPASTVCASFTPSAGLPAASASRAIRSPATAGSVSVQRSTGTPAGVSTPGASTAMRGSGVAVRRCATSSTVSSSTGAPSARSVAAAPASVVMVGPSLGRTRTRAAGAVGHGHDRGGHGGDRLAAGAATRAEECDRRQRNDVRAADHARP